MSRLIRLALLLVSLACLGAWSAKASAAVVWQAVGTAVSGTTTTGIGANPAWPAHAVNDIALLFVESTGGQPVTLGIPNGFVAVANSPQATGAGTAGTQLSVFWARATSAAMPAPSIASPSDHFYARIITFRGVINTGDPIDATAGGVKAAASTTVTLSGVTTTVANALVVQAVARDNDSGAAAFSAQTNVSLTGITEHHDAGTALGNGGGLGVWSGVKATAGATGNTTATVTSSINAFLTIALKPQPGPKFQAAGTALGGTGAVSPAWPAHAIDDVALLFVESTGGQAATLSTPAGFAAVLNSPQATGAGTAGTRLTVFWARATSAAMPTPTVANPGNHVYAQIITYRGVANTGNPWDVTGGGVKTPASTSVTVTGVTTTVADTLVVQAVARDNDSAAAAFSAQTNANLTGIAERQDAGTTAGNGGGFAVWDGDKAVAGATGNTTATVTSSINAFLTIALRPGAAPAPVFQALGTIVTTGLNWPAHAVDDVGLLFIETTGGQIPTLADAQGFVEVANSPQATGAGLTGTRLTVFWARATSTAMAGPTITGPANHAYAQIITYRGATNVGDPWDVTGGGVKAGASTTVTVTGVTTTVDDTLVVQAVAHDNDSAAAAFSAQTNANLTGIAERSDAGTAVGNGGGFVVWDGAKAVAGATGNTTATVTSSINAFLTIALKPPPPPPPDHYELSVPASSITCLPTTVTITACADSSNPCSNVATTTMGDVSLASTGGTIVSPATLTSGVATTTLSFPLAPDSTAVTVSLTGAMIAALNGPTCQGGVSGCTTTFNTAGLIFSSTAGGAVATIPDQVAGVSSSTFYLRAIRTNTTTQACEAALAGANAVNFAYECNDPAICFAANLMSVDGGAATTIARNDNGSVSTYTPVNMTFDTNGNAPFTFNYSDVGQVTLWVNKTVNSALLAGSSNAFVVKPFDFGVIPCAASVVGDCVSPPADPGLAGGGSVFAKAGDSFKTTVTARTSGGAATPSFGLGSNNATETVNLTHTRVAPVGVGAADGALNGTTSILRSSFSNGIATISDLSWSEVGVITLTATNNIFLGNALVTTGSTGNIGRFYPEHFDTAVVLSAGIPMPCPLGLTCPTLYNGFVYSGQAFSTQVTAKNLAGGTTQNYDGALGYARSAVLSAWDALGSIVTQNPSGTLSNNAITAATFSTGVATTSTPVYTLATTTTAPTDIYIRADDTDGVSSRRAASPGTSVEGGVKVVSGRIRLASANGSELLTLPIAVTAQYWNGTAYVISTTDSQSSFAPANVLFSNYQKNLSVGETIVMTPPATIMFTNGIAGYRLTAPGSGNNGSVDMTTNAPTYLPSNTARATFGVYKGANEFIYLRENY